MAKLRNTDKIFDLELHQSITVGHNRVIKAVRYGDGIAYQCKLHGFGIALIAPQGRSGVARVTLNDCGYPTPTTRDAMSDFARAFGCSLSVSFAKGGMSARFKNAAGTIVDREMTRGQVNGPYAMGRYE